MTDNNASLRWWMFFGFSLAVSDEGGEITRTRQFGSRRRIQHRQQHVESHQSRSQTTRAASRTFTRLGERSHTSYTNTLTLFFF